MNKVELIRIIREIRGLNPNLIVGRASSPPSLRLRSGQVFGARYLAYKRLGIKLSLFLALFSCPDCSGDPASRLFKTGEDLWNKGEYTQAIEQYAKVVHDYPNSALVPSAIFQMGTIFHLYLHDYPRALTTYSQLTYYFPTNKYTFLARKNMAEIYQYKYLDFQKAIIEYRKLVNNYPQHHELDHYQYQIAQCYCKLNAFEQALIEYRTLIERFPHTTLADEVYYQIANTYYLQGKLLEAERIYQEMISKFPTSPLIVEAKFGTANCLEEREALNQALAIYQEIADKYPNQKAIRLKIENVKERKQKRKR